MAGSILRGRRARWLVGTIGASVALGVGAVPGLATTIDRDHFSGTDSFTDTSCGFTLNVESTFEGNARLRVVKGTPAFLQLTRVRATDVVTNPATGKWFVIRDNALFNEIKATQVDGDVYRFTAVEAGQPFVVEDSDGNVVVRDRGVIRHVYDFDTLGDDTPGGEFVAVVEEVVHGPHPGFGDDFDFCGLAAELTGA